LLLAAAIHRLLLRSTAVIVLFHRVDDALAGDPLSCSRRDFQAFCDFFRRYFRVVSLAVLVEKLQRGEDIGRHLVITFDDGYLDNLEVAAEELKARGLPACFFVATSFIGSRCVPFWDAEKGIASRWMSWADVRQLRAQGFEVGAHTMDHVDLGRTQRTDAAREIAGSRASLEQALGTDIRLFSYPFGRRDNITEENRAEVRKAGFRCCVSAFGGLVTGVTDPFHMPRVPIGLWYGSPYEFGFEVLREAAREGRASGQAPRVPSRSAGVA
jgi:peptidoglycan/xylan/chitin deacetylase (PgdA/CDA1 family)